MLPRAARISGICDRCAQPARTRCRRCRRPLCRRHEPHVDRRCPPCETELAARRQPHERDDRRLAAAVELLRLTPVISLSAAVLLGAIGLLFGLAVGGSSEGLYLGTMTFAAAFGLSALLYGVAILALVGLGGASWAVSRLRLGAARASFLRERRDRDQSAAIGDEEE